MSSAPLKMSTVERVLVIKMSALGDIAKSIPTVDAIRETYPQLRIGWVARQGLSDLLIGNPSIDELFVAPRGVPALRAMAGSLRKFKPDVVLDMQGLFISGCLGRLSGAKRRYTWESGRELSGLLAGNAVIPAPSDENVVESLFRFAKLLGVKAMPNHPPAYLTQDPVMIARVEALLGGVPGSLVGMHIGASVPNKTWPVEHWAELADRLLEAGYEVVLFGGRSEIKAAEEIKTLMRGQPISLVNKTTPRELAAAISRCRLFIGGDTGATHIATLVHTPTIALMGATDPVQVGPYGSAHTTIYLGLPCSPCYRHPTCGGRYDCMRKIDATMVFRACVAKLSAKTGIN